MSVSTESQLARITVQKPEGQASRDHPTVWAEKDSLAVCVAAMEAS
jgi:hypothetical protein